MPGGQFLWGTSLLKSNGGVHQGRLAADGNRSDSVNAQAGLTARRMCRADAKAGVSEPTLMRNLKLGIGTLALNYDARAPVPSSLGSSARRSGEDHQIKATPGITGWYHPSVHSDGGVRHLDVGSKMGRTQSNLGWQVYVSK